MIVFFGSTYQDLRQHREKVLEVLKYFSHNIEAMEYWCASTNTPLEECLSRVKQCDLYLCVIAFRYGSLANDGYSFTHKEYLLARESGKDVLVFLMDPQTPIPASFVDAGSSRNKLNAFRNDLQYNHHCAYFGTSENLAHKVEQALRDYMIDKNVITPGDIVASWTKIKSKWSAVEPEDVRVNFDETKPVLEIIDEAQKTIDAIQSLTERISNSHDSLDADMRKVLKQAGTDSAFLDTMHYWENPFINRDWEFLNIGFPNCLSHLRIHVTQIEVHYLELLAQTKMWDEKMAEQLVHARNKLEELVSIYRID